MRMQYWTALGAMVLMGHVPLANAELAGKGHIGGAVTQWTFSQKNFPDAEGTGFRVMAGYSPFEFLGIEVQIAGGGSDTVSVTTLIPADDPADPPTVGVFDVEAKLNQMWSLMLRPQFAFGERLNVFGLVGYSYAKMDFRSEPSWFSDSDTGVSYGVGAEFGVIPGTLYLGLDYVQYLDKSDYEASGMSAGVRYTF